MPRTFASGARRRSRVRVATTVTAIPDWPRSPDPPAPLGVAGPVDACLVWSRDAGLELLTELDRPPVRRPHRLRQDSPKAAGFELVESRGARATRRRDHVAQLRRMHPRLLGEDGAALERLDDEVVRDVAREAEVDGSVDQRLHDEEHVR